MAKKKSTPAKSTGKTVKIAELKAKLSAYLRRAQKGERITVLDRDEPIATLGPVDAPQLTGIARLIAEGVVTPAREPLKGNPFRGVKVDISAQELLDFEREDRF